MTDEVSNAEMGLRLKPVPSRLGLVSQAPQTPKSFHVDWGQFLKELTTFGLVELNAINSCAALTSRGEPWYAHLDGKVAVVQGPCVYLVGNIRQWTRAQLRTSQSGRAPDQLSVLDRAGESLLRISLTEDSTSPGIYCGCARGWPTSDELPKVGAEAHNHYADDLRALQRCGADWLPSDIGNPWYGTTGGPKLGTAVDPTLIAPFLETMVDQACPVRVMLGNHGMIQAYNAEYFDLRQARDKLDLRSAASKLSINLTGLGSVRVHRAMVEASVHRVYLFDDHERGALRLELGPSANQACHSLWQTMTKALTDY